MKSVTLVLSFVPLVSSPFWGLCGLFLPAPGVCFPLQVEFRSLPQEGGTATLNWGLTGGTERILPEHWRSGLGLIWF